MKAAEILNRCFLREKQDPDNIIHRSEHAVLDVDLLSRRTKTPKYIRNYNQALRIFTKRFNKRMGDMDDINKVYESLQKAYQVDFQNDKPPIEDNTKGLPSSIHFPKRHSSVVPNRTIRASTITPTPAEPLPETENNLFMLSEVDISNKTYARRAVSTSRNERRRNSITQQNDLPPPPPPENERQKGERYRRNFKQMLQSTKRDVLKVKYTNTFVKGLDVTFQPSNFETDDSFTRDGFFSLKNSNFTEPYVKLLTLEETFENRVKRKDVPRVWNKEDGKIVERLNRKLMNSLVGGDRSARSYVGGSLYMKGSTRGRSVGAQNKSVVAQLMHKSQMQRIEEEKLTSSAAGDGENKSYGTYEEELGLSLLALEEKKGQIFQAVKKATNFLERIEVTGKNKNVPGGTSFGGWRVHQFIEAMAEITEREAETQLEVNKTEKYLTQLLERNVNSGKRTHIPQNDPTLRTSIVADWNSMLIAGRESQENITSVKVSPRDFKDETVVSKTIRGSVLDDKEILLDNQNHLDRSCQNRFLQTVKRTMGLFTLIDNLFQTAIKDLNRTTVQSQEKIPGAVMNVNANNPPSLLQQCQSFSKELHLKFEEFHSELMNAFRSATKINENATEKDKKINFAGSGDRRGKLTENSVAAKGKLNETIVKFDGLKDTWNEHFRKGLNTIERDRPISMWHRRITYNSLVREDVTIDKLRIQAESKRKEQFTDKTFEQEVSWYNCVLDNKVKRMLHTNEDFSTSRYILNKIKDILDDGHKLAKPHIDSICATLHERYSETINEETLDTLRQCLSHLDIDSYRYFTSFGFL